MYRIKDVEGKEVMVNVHQIASVETNSASDVALVNIGGKTYTFTIDMLLYLEIISRGDFVMNVFNEKLFNEVKAQRSGSTRFPERG